MSELVLNDANLDEGFESLVAVAGVITSIERGLVHVFDTGMIERSLRLPRPTTEIRLGEGITLARTLIHMLRDRTSEAGRLFAGLATKFPVEDDLEESAFESLVEWKLVGYPDCLTLLLCAASGRIAVSISANDAWYRNPLDLEIIKNSQVPDERETVPVDHIYDEASGAEVRTRLENIRLNTISASDLWNDRAILLPNLDLAPGVRRNIANLTRLQLSAAISRLRELDKASRDWQQSGSGSPTYASKVTAESAPTMEKYGNDRLFRGVDGLYHIFEQHARLPDGYRVHLREVAEIRRIEIGYVGPHLPTVQFH